MFEWSTGEGEHCVQYVTDSKSLIETVSSLSKLRGGVTGVNGRSLGSYRGHYEQTGGHWGQWEITRVI